jgi:hypothetical protein
VGVICCPKSVWWSGVLYEMRFASYRMCLKKLTRLDEAISTASSDGWRGRGIMTQSGFNCGVSLLRAWRDGQGSGRAALSGVGGAGHLLIRSDITQLFGAASQQMKPEVSMSPRLNYTAPRSLELRLMTFVQYPET